MDPFLALKIAAREVTEEKMAAMLVKLRKGAYGSFTVKQLIAVMEHLGGWEIVNAVGLEPGPAHPYGHEVDTNTDWIKQKWEEAKRLEVKTLPTNPAKGQRYTMDVSDISEASPMGGPRTGFKYLDWWGSEALRFISPEGKVFDLIGREPYKISPVYKLLPWIYKETNFVEVISKRLALPTPEEEKANKAPRTRDNTGSCPCCFGNFKLRSKSSGLPEMVLHGFKRPGWGQIHGSCIGIRFPPFELSPEGTKHLVNLLERRLEDLQNQLKDHQDPQFSVMYVEVRNGVKKVMKESESEYNWKQLLERETRQIEGMIKSVSYDLKTLTKLVSSWKLQPLPEPGKSMPVWK